MKHEFSLASKLATLAVGQVIYLPDDAPLMGPTQMERQVHGRISRSSRLANRKFTTSRCDLITVDRNHEHVLKVERIE